MLVSRAMARIWVLTSGRTGDDKQSLRLGAALGLPFEEKKIVFNERARAWRLMLGPSLESVDRGRSSELAAPWPDLVISTGWRQVPVVRAVERTSGGRTKLVQLNRPPGPQHFDLVLSPPQYAVPARPNVIPLEWPLQLPPSPDQLSEASLEWRDRLAGLRHPWTVLLLGGSSFPFLFDPATAGRLFDDSLERTRSQRGSLLLTTSRRTPAETLAVLRERVAREGDDVFFFEWQPDAADNPYRAFLAGGDEFVVTPDSISMLVEVARLGRPLAVAPATRDRSIAKRLRNASKRWIHGPPGRPQSAIRERISDLASILGLKYGRDLERVSRRMIERGWAAPFPDFGGGEGPARKLPDEEFDQLVTRVRALLPRGDG